VQRRDRSGRGDIWTILFVLSIALLCAQISFRLRADTLISTFHLELDALQGRARYPEFQNRLLAPGVLAGLQWLLSATVSRKRALVSRSLLAGLRRLRRIVCRAFV
jgi:hypothetical protein